MSSGAIVGNEKEEMDKLFGLLKKAAKDPVLTQELEVNPHAVIYREGIDNQTVKTFVAGDKKSIEDTLVKAGYTIPVPKIIRW